MRRALLLVPLLVVAVAGPAAADPPWVRPVPPSMLDGAHLSLGATAPATHWLFAEGHTGPDFEEFLVVNNGGNTPATVQVAVLGSGAATQIGVRPHARASVNVKDLMPAGDGGLAVTSDQPVTAERVMYFDYHGLTGGSSTLGVTDTAPSWFFAEGYSGPGFSSFILVANPSAVAVEATITFQRDSGGPVAVPVMVPARGRTTLNAADFVPGASFTTRVVAQGGVVAERAMYFSYGGGNGGDVAMGATNPAPRWDFAEGSTSSFDTFYAVGNPNAVPAIVTIVLRTGGGNVVTRQLSVAPGARATLKANDASPNTEAGATITSLLPIVAERAMYYVNALSSGGTSTLGAASLSPNWYFAEGFTSSDFETFVLMANPSDQATSAHVSLRRPDGAGNDLQVPLPARSRASVRVNSVPGLDHTEFATFVEAGAPVVAERVTYFRYPTPFFDGNVLGHRLLSEGDTGSDVYETQRRFTQLGFDPGPVDGTFTDVMVDATVALEKYAGLARRGQVGDEERAFLIAGRPPQARLSGTHVEVDITRQVGLYVRDGQVIGIWPTSTGALDNTPRGQFHVYRKVLGWDCGDVGCLYNSSYFYAGFAIHGYPTVPVYPASHGCTRVPMSMSGWIWDSLPIGFEVDLYD